MILAFLSWRWGGLLTSFFPFFFLDFHFLMHDADKEKSLAYCLFREALDTLVHGNPFDLMICFP